MGAQPDRYLALAWRKSRASGPDAGCVEVADMDSLVLVRDSHDRSGSVLKFPAGRWSELLQRIKNGAAG
jgi:Domain of unknown function (DUF397)